MQGARCRGVGGGVHPHLLQILVLERGQHRPVYLPLAEGVRVLAHADVDQERTHLLDRERGEWFGRDRGVRGRDLGRVRLCTYIVQGEGLSVLCLGHRV